MSKQSQIEALRGDPEVHYNCAQSVLIPYAEELGMDRETACRMAQHFGGGMKIGATCGAVTGALMALGLMGGTQQQAQQLIRRFREEHGALDCAQLLKLNRERGGEKKPHCDRMVYDAARLLEEICQEQN